MADLLNAYVLQNGLPPPAEQALRELPADVVMSVMRAGPLQQVPGIDVSALFVQRVQQVAHDVQLQQVQVQVQQQQALASGMPPPPPPPQVPMQLMQGMPPPPAVVQPISLFGQGLVSADPLTDFCRGNGVDAAVEQVLRSAQPELQIRVMQEGPLVGGNPSEVLIARVKRIMGQAPG